MSHEGPDWLADFQRDFGALLRIPLARDAGALRADLASYPDALTALVDAADPSIAAEQLATYHRQYWFRLFTALQSAFPLVTELATAWEFNRLAEQHLLRRPPRHADLARIADGFVDALDAIEFELGVGIPRDAVLEAARIDDAFRLAFEAPESPIWTPSATELADCATRRLVRSPALVRVDETRAWVARRVRAAEERMDDRPRLPPVHEGGPARWMLRRVGATMQTHRVSTIGAELLDLLRDHPLPIALAELEARTPASDRQGLPARVQAWFAESVARGVWSGLELRQTPA